MSGYGPARERELARRLELARRVVGRVDRLRARCPTRSRADRSRPSYGDATSRLRAAEPSRRRRTRAADDVIVRRAGPSRHVSDRPHPGVGPGGPVAASQRRPARSRRIAYVRRSATAPGGTPEHADIRCEACPMDFVALGPRVSRPEGLVLRDRRVPAAGASRPDARTRTASPVCSTHVSVSGLTSPARPTARDRRPRGVCAHCDPAASGLRRALTLRGAGISLVQSQWTESEPARSVPLAGRGRLVDPRRWPSATLCARASSPTRDAWTRVDRHPHEVRTRDDACYALDTLRDPGSLAASGHSRPLRRRSARSSAASSTPSARSASREASVV